MARIAGVDLPSQKPLKIGLAYIYGIGRSTALQIIREAGINPDKRIKDLDAEEIERIRSIIENAYKVEGALKAEVSENIKRLISIKSYRGIRHKRSLPVRGQRTRTNARTRKGPKKGQIALKKKTKTKTKK